MCVVIETNPHLNIQKPTEGSNYARIYGGAYADTYHL